MVNDVVGADCWPEKLPFVVLTAFLLCQPTSFCPRPFYTSATATVRSCHVVEECFVVNTFFRWFTRLWLVCGRISPRLCPIRRNLVKIADTDPHIIECKWPSWVDTSLSFIITAPRVFQWRHEQWHTDCTGTKSGSWWWTSWPCTLPMIFAISSTGSYWILRVHGFIDTDKSNCRAERDATRKNAARTW